MDWVGLDWGCVGLKGEDGGGWAWVLVGFLVEAML